MTPSLALLLWAVLLLGLLYFDPAKDSRISSAIWVPVIWMFDHWISAAFAMARRPSGTGSRSPAGRESV